MYSEYNEVHDEDVENAAMERWHEINDLAKDQGMSRDEYLEWQQERWHQCDRDGW